MFIETFTHEEKEKRKITKRLLLVLSNKFKPHHNCIKFHCNTKNYKGKSMSVPGSGGDEYEQMSLNAISKVCIDY